MRLIFDTETNGLPDFRAPSDAPHQPHICQFAALLLDDDWTERACVNLIVRPDGWTIPDDVAAIHGITTEIAERCGVPEDLVVRTYISMLGADNDRLVIAHNIKFDARIMRIAMLRHSWKREEVEVIEGMTKTFCTMENSKSLVKAPLSPKQVAAGFTGFKAPRLEKAHQFFFNEPLPGAHDALVDARACARLYRHLHEIGAA
jgi:DNA polymerase-3 subunit epsilon